MVARLENRLLEVCRLQGRDVVRLCSVVGAMPVMKQGAKVGQVREVDWERVGGCECDRDFQEVDLSRR